MEVTVTWPIDAPVPTPVPVPGYHLVTMGRSQRNSWIDVQHAAVPRYSREDLRGWLGRYLDLALPGGVLLAVHSKTSAPVATAGSLRRGEIAWVATVPAHQRRGLARWLCTHALTRLLTEGCETITISTGTDMPEALSLYESLGFRHL